MKYTLLLLLILSSFLLSGQYHFDKNDFFEVQGNYATIAKNKFDVFPNSSRGATVSGTNNLKGYGVGIRYGKALASFAHLTFGVSYSKREESIVNSLELFKDENRYSYSKTIKSMNSVIFEFGPRIKFVNTTILEISAGGGGFAKLTPKSANDFLFGYYAHGIIGLNFNERIQVNAKYGFETTEGRFRNSSFPVEIAWHYKIY